MDRRTETLETWNKVALLYQEKFMDLTFYNKTYDAICDAIVKENAAILEVGCGPGNIARYLLSKRKDWNIMGIDIAPAMIALAKENVPQARFEVFDTRNIHELNTNFDGIVCGFCMPYLSEEDCLRLISNSYNLLKEEGILYLSFIEGDPLNSGYQVGSSGDKLFVYFHRLHDIKLMLFEHKFENLTIFPIEYVKSDGEMEIHTIVIASKSKSL